MNCQLLNHKNYCNENFLIDEMDSQEHIDFDDYFLDSHQQQIFQLGNQTPLHKQEDLQLSHRVNLDFSSSTFECNYDNEYGFTTKSYQLDNRSYSKHSSFTDITDLQLEAQKDTLQNLNFEESVTYQNQSINVLPLPQMEKDQTQKQAQSSQKPLKQRIRNRTAKNSEQVKVLNNEWKKNQSWNVKLMKTLSERTGLTCSQVYKWHWDKKKEVEIEYLRYFGSTLPFAVQQMSERAPKIFKVTRMTQIASSD